ncbi:MAG TPA: helix-turn-helix domain-containing protein [Candidatus Limnocylindria bacterium]|nr:helix-turn-helix domain-containing protein [Candidatus Limnocylindria bacterium]
MGSSASTDYCAFTKAVEHLGDRWSFLIVRELAMFGTQGFNTLATGLPGRVSRSVLAAKLRKLEELGLVARIPSATARSAPYSLTPAGEQLVPTLQSLWQWARKWVPEDAAMAQRDPSVIVWWLTRRVDRRRAPAHQVAIEVSMPAGNPSRFWILLAREAEPTLCVDDPMLGQDRYVYIEADPVRLLPVARGERAWADALADASVHASGEPALVHELPDWFLPALS